MYSKKIINPPMAHYKWDLWNSPGIETNSPEEKNENMIKKWVKALTGVMNLTGNIWIAYDAWNAVEKAKLSNNSSVQQTLTILDATGITSGSMKSFIARWWEGSGKSWAKKVIEALETAQKWETQIITYSNNSYTTSSLREYEKNVNSDTNTMNVSAMKWLYSLRWSGVWFSESTWSKIWLYIYSYNESWKWKDSRLVKELDIASIANLKKIWESMKTKEAIKLDIIAKDILWKMKSGNGNISQLFAHTDLRMNADNKTIDVSGIIANFEKNKDKLTIEQIEQKFRDLAQTMKKNGDLLIKEWKQSIKDIPGSPKTLREIGIHNIPYNRLGKQIDLSDELIANINPEEASSMIIAVDVHKKSISKQSDNYDETRKTIEQILQSLILIREGKKMNWQAGQLEVTANTIKNQKEKGGTRENIEIPRETILQTANNIAVASAQLRATQNDLDDYHIHTLDQAKDKLEQLKSKPWSPTPEEKYLIKLLEQYIRDHYDSAKQYQLAQEYHGQKIAQDIFIQTDRFISANPNKKYNFEQLEQIAQLWDNEITAENQILISMKPGEKIPMNSLIKGEEWDTLTNTSEISHMYLEMNSDGTYDIRLLKAYHLTQNEVQEYITNIILYSELWLSQFIPHISLITTELRKKWTHTAVDGNSGTMEQQQVLKKLYSLLFKENIEPTTSLPEVKKAFHRKMDYPINMKENMQVVLKQNKLIKESDQPIDSDTLQKWIRW